MPTKKGGKKKKKGKGKGKVEEDASPDDATSGSSEEISLAKPSDGTPAVDLDERVRQDIQSAASRKTPGVRTPAPLSR